jgi:predicted component of type VI protein secretion system
MKSHNQMIEHEPSDLIPLYDGMVISFINYEIRVNLEKKDASQIQTEEQQISRANEQLAKTSNEFQTTVKAHAVAKVEETKVQHVPVAVAEVVHVPVPEPEPVVVVAKVDVND